MAQSDLPKNSTILIIRHAEKPRGGVGLAATGRARALAYVDYFQSFSVGGGPPLTIDYVFAAANSNSSCRPQLTIMPTAAALDLPIDDQIADEDYKTLASAIGKDAAYDDSTLLICWHHGHALLLANELAGVKLETTLPVASAWPPDPKTWPADVFGWVLIIVSDADGKLDPDSTKAINENLMPDDAGHDPPSGTSA